ncbi:MFS superfamily sulfate permease-like transporter [Streptomyces sp. B4I13]|nr:MFS superfamily sulfate permease-like transporter [Streptomyces sp. B4I13]
MSQSSVGRTPRWRRLVPGLGALFGYRRSWLRGDVLAGVTVAAYLVPQVMAYAGVAGLPPVAGLWAILPALAVYTLLGSSLPTWSLAEHLSRLHLATVLFAVAALGVLFTVAHFFRAVPGPCSPWCSARRPCPSSTSTANMASR